MGGMIFERENPDAGDTSSESNFALPQDSNFVEARRCSACGHESDCRPAAMAALYDELDSQWPLSTETLHNESIHETDTEYHAFSDSSSTIAVLRTAYTGALSIKSVSFWEDNEESPTPPIPSRYSLGHLPMFLPHPAVRPILSKAMWRPKSWQSTSLDEEQKPNLSQGTSPAACESSGMSTAHEWLFIATMCLAQLLSLAGLAQSFAPLFIIARSFNVTDPGQMSWYTAAYSMTLGTFILPAGRLGDMYGHKKMVLIGWLWFSLWCFITGFSHNGGTIMLSTCRALQGIGPALLVPNSIALLGRVFPIGMKRAVSMAIFGGCGPIGFVTGVVFSSLFAQLLWWPWSFWAMAITCSLVAILTYLVVPTDASRASVDDAAAQPKEHFDWLGSLTGVTGLLLINFALNEAPVEGWEKIYIPVVLSAGLLLIVSFIYVELHVAANPIVPLRGLHKEAAYTLACISTGWASHGIWCYYLFLFFENIRGNSALLTAAQIWPVAPIGFCAALAVPWILREIQVPYLMSIAMLCFAGCIALLVTAPADQSYFSQTMASILIAPLAMNWSFPSGTILMSNAMPKRHQGVGASLIATAVNYSIATGLGVAGTLDRYLTPTHGVLGGYRDAWWLGIALALFGFLISLYFIWQTARRSTVVK